MFLALKIFKVKRKCLSDVALTSNIEFKNISITRAFNMTAGSRIHQQSDVSVGNISKS